jgi:hypothetical protein
LARQVWMGGHLLELYIYFGFPLARLKWSILLKLVRLPLQRGGGPEAGLCKLNRQERRRWLQERTETMRNAFRDSETDWKRR